MITVSPYLQYNGVRYVGIEKMLNIYRRAYVMRPLIEPGTVLTKNYECMLAALNKLYQKNKIIGTKENSALLQVMRQVVKCQNSWQFEIEINQKRGTVKRY